MRRIIYISGIVSVNLLLFGALFKIMHWSGAGIMLTLAIVFFVFWFVPTALINNYRSLEKPQNPALHIIVFIVCLLDFTGALFKLMHWPGAGIMMIVGILAPFVLFLPAYMIRFNKQNQKPDTNFFAVMFLFVYIAVIGVFLALRISKEVIDYGIITEENTQNTYLSLKIVEDNDNIKNHTGELKQKTDDICSFIDQLKAGIIKINGNNPQETIKENKQVDLWKVKGKDVKVPAKIFFSELNSNGNLEKLNKEIDAYKEYLLKLIPEEENHKKDFVNDILDISYIYYSHDLKFEPGKINLININQMMAINVLTQLETNIRLAELQVL